MAVNWITRMRAKKHEHETYRFQLQMFLGYQHLEVKNHVEITDCSSYSMDFNNTEYSNITRGLGAVSQIAMFFYPYTG
jgi:hypothetical protein